jgi:hypothetical protein
MLGAPAPKFSRETLKRYFSFGINKPCELADWSLANGTVNLLKLEIAILFCSLYSFIYHHY